MNIPNPFDQNKFFKGPAGEYMVCPSLTQPRVFEVHDDHAGDLLATTKNRAGAEKLAALLAVVPITLKPMRESSG